ncbi:polysaccharide deacetylase family protein [Bacteriovoracales bacterium]|nr:polysaccharide deacetylase family protein [Bacteriovoracales bacterium]
MSLGVMFHHFYDDIHPKGQGAISEKEFESILDYYQKNYNLLRANDWLLKAKARSLSERDVCITFDDCLKCQFDVAFPVLEKRNLTAFWFVYSSVLEGGAEVLEVYRYFRTVCYKDDIEDFYKDFFPFLYQSENSELIKEGLKGFIPEDYLKSQGFYSRNDRIFRYLRDRVLGKDLYNNSMDLFIELKGFNREEVLDLLWMDNENLKTLKSLDHIVGLHSHSHPTCIANLSYEKQKEEYRKNYNYLKDLLGVVPETVAHPCGSYNEDTLEVLKSLGVNIGFRANMSFPDRGGLEFPREDHINVLRRIEGENNSFYQQPY